jgi:S-adenosylmethionine synthetase
MSTFLFTSESVNEGHPGTSTTICNAVVVVVVFWGVVVPSFASVTTKILSVVTALVGGRTTTPTPIARYSRMASRSVYLEGNDIRFMKDEARILG